MPTSETTIDSLVVGTAAEARAFVTAFKTKLEAVGFTSTSDTGQFDESTGVGSTSANTLWGHKMFRTPDSDPSHSVMPIYMKARFRTAASAPSAGTGSAGISPHFGTGSDGASGLTDPWLPHADTFWMQLSNADPANMWVVRNSLMGGFVIGGIEGDNYDDQAGGWFYHRTVDASGNPTTDGFYALTFTLPLPAASVGSYVAVVGPASQYLLSGVLSGGSSPTVYAIASTENYYDRSRDKWRGESHPMGGGHRGFRIPDYPSLGLDGSNAVHRPYVGDKFDSLDRPLVGLVAYHRTAHAIGDTFTLSRYGADRTFLATPLRVCAPTFAANKLDWRLAVLWE